MSMKAILFDNDGTLVDTYELILSSMRHATRTVLGREIAEDALMAKVGQPLAVQVALRGHAGDAAQALHEGR